MNVRIFKVDWYSGKPIVTGGGYQLAYQGDDMSNMVVFDKAPSLNNYYLVVRMKLDEADSELTTLPAIQLEGPYWVVPNYYTQIAQTILFQCCSRTPRGDYEHHSAWFSGTVLPSIKHNGDPIDLSPMFDPYMAILDDKVTKLIIAAGYVQIDSEMSDSSTNPVQNKVVTGVLAEVNGRLDELEQGGTGGGMSEEAKQALLNLVSHIGLWDDSYGQGYIDALEAALYPPAGLTRITAVYTQSGAVYEGSNLNNLKADLVVTAVYSDSTTEVITAYTLTGTLEEGTSTITVSYGGKTTTFDVTVTGRLLPSGYQQLEYVYSDGGVYFESTVSPRAYPIRVETGIYKAQQASGEQAVLIKGSSAALLELGYTKNANTMFAYSGTSAKVTNAVVYGNVLDVVAEFNSTSPYKSLSVTANDETVSAQNTDANDTKILNANNLLFFGSGATSLNYVGRMYYCRVYSNGELIGNFIPCYDKSTGYAGMYETVGGTFHYSRGVNGFKRGGEV